MTFEEFWKQNRERYLKLSEVNIMLAICAAAEDAWENSAANTVGVPNFQPIVVGIKEPRYDEVFFQGLDELNKISSEDIPIEFLKIIDDHFDELA